MRSQAGDDCVEKGDSSNSSSTLKESTWVLAGLATVAVVVTAIVGFAVYSLLCAQPTPRDSMGRGEYDVVKGFNEKGWNK